MALHDSNLVVPEDARGLVLITGDVEHDAVLGRLASDLRESRLATLLMRPEVSGDAILDACRYLDRDRPAAGLSRGIAAFGSAAAPALQAAADRDAGIRAVVCVDARFDGVPIADEVPAPTLLVVADEAERPDSERLLASVAGERELQIVRSSHRSIEERLEEESQVAVRWFSRHLHRR
jgi:hypothetical protein